MTDHDRMQLAQEFLHLLSQFRRIDWSSDTKHKIRQSEFRLLLSLHHSGASSMKVSELSALMQITPAAVTHLINTLEKDGCVRRLADPGDRRVVLVQLTDTGARALKTAKAHFLTALSSLVGHLGPLDARELLRLLNATLIYLKDLKKGM